MRSDNSSWNRFARLKVSSKDVNKRLRKIEKGSLRHAHKFVTSRLDRLSNVRRRVSVWIILVLVMIGASAVQWHYFSQFFHDNGVHFWRIVF